LAQLATDLLAHPAKSTDDVMIPYGLYLAFHSDSFENIAELAGDHIVGQCGEGVGDGPYAEQDQDRGKKLAGLAQGMNFSKADGGDGDDRHVKGVDPGPALYQCKPNGPEGDDRDKDEANSQ
jgi:hypothetical protein